MRPRTLASLGLVAAAGLALALPLLSGTTQAASRFAPSFSGAFWAHWSDGKAELAGYRLTQPRYGELRQGSAVAVFVKEDLSESSRLKVEPSARGAFPAMKLNLVEDFQTGLYDYNVMTSTFLGLADTGGRSAGAVAKVAFSAQEWCGHTFHQLLFDARRVRQTLHSYFDGEGDRLSTLDAHEDGLVGDAVLLWARGMTGPVLAPGEVRKTTWLPTLKDTRFEHQTLGWKPATLRRSTGSRPLTVPAGSFDVEERVVEVEGGPSWKIFVEAAFPHRVVAWENDAGLKAELLGADRLPYWQLHDEGQERFLEKLGLSPPRR